jgi:flagellar biosynthesis/type III secretory pathway chaperone
MGQTSSQEKRVRWAKVVREEKKKKLIISFQPLFHSSKRSLSLVGSKRPALSRLANTQKARKREPRTANVKKDLLGVQALVVAFFLE